MLDEQHEHHPADQEALDALRSYLSDSIPPLIFAESAPDLFKMPVRATASEILGWVASQSQIGDAVRTADYLFHAVKKLHLLGELELLPRQRVHAFLGALRPLLVDNCPPHEKEGLARDLMHLEESKGDVATVLGVGQRSAAGPGPRMSAARGSDSGLGHGQAGGGFIDQRRVGILLHRLADYLDTAQVRDDSAVRSPLVTGIIAEAAATARDGTELEASLGQLKGYGVPEVQEGIVRILGQSLPDWAAPAVATPDQAPPQNAVRAMQRIITLAGDRQEKYKRFDELVVTAVEEFNSGSLGRAVTLLDLAGRMIETSAVDSSIVTAVRDKAYEALDEAQLRRCAEDQEKHYLFRRVMTFFPKFQPAELFVELEDETGRDRRRLLLHLLTAQGAPARMAALDALKGAAAGERSFPWYVERNLVYLLRTIERPDDVDADAEIDALSHVSQLDRPLPLIREGMATMGQINNERVVRALVARVSELEDAVLGARAVPYSEEEIRSLLDTAVTMLARNGSPEACRCIVAHGLKRQPELGNTLARVARLGNTDLSSDASLVKRLVDALREELPTRVLGVAVGVRRRSDNVERLVEALSSTNTPLVRTVLQEIGQRYSSQPFGQTALRTLDGLGVPTAAETPGTAALAGDLGLFGLPSLLQNLSDSQLTGVLSLIGTDGETAASLRLDNGMISNAHCGRLRGEAAVYQLLERPIVGRFVFVDNDEESVVNMEQGVPKPVQPLLFEGIRRYDEFLRATSIAPDHSAFTAGEKKPTRPGDEPDINLVKAVWQRTVGGGSPADCEADVQVDSYRVRRLIEHWVSEGSLIPATRQS